MNQQLKDETRALKKTWNSRKQSYLKEYLKIGRQDPRINLQSILTRHLIIYELFGSKFNSVMLKEIKFAIHVQREYKNEFEKIYYHTIKNNISKSMKLYSIVRENLDLNKYIKIWNKILQSQAPCKNLNILEVGCGSANDYAYFVKTNIIQFINYKGIDISGKNVTNAKTTFPEANFCVGNILDNHEETNSYDICVVFDLFEHLSLNAINISLHELDRIAKNGLILNFFNMKEIENHVIIKKKLYHFNKLSKSRLERYFLNKGYKVKIYQIKSFFPSYYNQNTYTFLVKLANDKEK